MFGGSKRRNIEKRLALLRSRVGSGETEFTLAAGREWVGQGEVEMVMLVTDRRVLWSYVQGGPKDLVLDIAFKDVVAFLGSEGEGMILEAAEGRCADGFGGQTTMARFRLKGLSSAIEVVRFVEAHIPSSARERFPDMEGTNTHVSRRTGEMLFMFSAMEAETAPAVPLAEGFLFGDSLIPWSGIERVSSPNPGVMVFNFGEDTSSAFAAFGVRVTELGEAETAWRQVLADRGVTFGTPSSTEEITEEALTPSTEEPTEEASPEESCTVTTISTHNGTVVESVDSTTVDALDYPGRTTGERAIWYAKAILWRERNVRHRKYGDPVRVVVRDSSGVVLFDEHR
jgi:hypothetical protein